MPWEKNFDIEEAVDKAMIVFWEKGYEATSITDLTEATGVQRQSLYNAFGTKQEFFLRTLLKFQNERQRLVLDSLERRDKPLDAVKTVFRDAIDDPHKRGCYVVNTALELQRHEDAVKKLVATASKDFRSFFARLIERGQEKGEIPPEVNAPEAAAGLLAGLYGIRVMGRGAQSKSIQRSAASQALQLLT